MKRRRVLPLSDLHVGSRYGLWPDGMTEEDPQTGEFSPLPPTQTNQKIREHWNKMLKSIEKAPPDIVVWNGDLIEGEQDHEKGKGLITRSIDKQCEGAEKMIQAVRDVAPDTVFYFTAGTGYHQRSNGESADRYLARQFDAEFGNELVIEECGIRIFARHVISSSMSTWQYMATAPGRDHMLLYLNKAPEKYGDIDAAIFSHRHQFVNVQFGSGMALVTPCWQSKTPYASVKKGIVGVPDIGWIVLNVEGPKQIMVDTRGIASVVRPCKVVGRDGRK